MLRPTVGICTWLDSTGGGRSQGGGHTRANAIKMSSRPACRWITQRAQSRRLTVATAMPPKIAESTRAAGLWDSGSMVLGAGHDSMTESGGWRPPGMMMNETTLREKMKWADDGSLHVSREVASPTRADVLTYCPWQTVLDGISV